MIDSLEMRLLLAGSISGGVLRIFGGTGEDIIKVDVGINTTFVTYFGAYQQFQTSAYTSIQIHSGAGNDWIQLAGQLSRPGLIDGEGGNDTILGSAQVETLLGGAGNDVIFYQFGDVIDAQEAGSNEFVFGTPPPIPEPTLSGGIVRVTGMSFSDTIVLDVFNTAFPDLHIMYGGNSKSFRAAVVRSIIIDGRGGNDRIQLNSTVFFPSRLYGGDGNDTIMGGSGGDRVYGGQGDDWINGYGGNDIIYGENGNDRLCRKALFPFLNRANPLSYYY